MPITVQQGYMPSLCSESPTHLAVIAAAISGTMYCKPPVNSNIITTNDTTKTYTGSMTVFAEPNMILCQSSIVTVSILNHFQVVVTYLQKFRGHETVKCQIHRHISRINYYSPLSISTTKFTCLTSHIAKMTVTRPSLEMFVIYRLTYILRSSCVLNLMLLASSIQKI